MSDVATASLVLSGVVLLVAASLAWKEWRERRGRSPDLSPEDARHFGYQDNRRSLGIVVLVLLAVGVVIGSYLPPRLDNRANPRFVGTWLGVFLLIFVLLALAMVDWVALRLFVRRHRNMMLRERIQILAEKKRLETDLGDEHDDHPDGSARDFLR